MEDTPAVRPATITDYAASESYQRSLQRTLSGVVSSAGTFVCPSSERCQQSIGRGHDFAGGQMSYVGPGYAAVSEGQDFRILVVSMQVGDSEAPVTMSRRSEQVRVRIPQMPKDRNPHMRGVTFALQYLFGHDLADETLSDGTHVLDAYAMANATLCSNLPTAGKSRRGGPTPTMLTACAGNLRSTIETLEPVVIHSQGRPRNESAPSPHAVLHRLFDDVEWVTSWIARVRLGSRLMVWCSLPHPSTGPPDAWQWPGHAFHQDVAEPSLRQARTLALEGL